MLAQLIQSPPMDVFGQMAVDEALALSHPETFCLRFFRWRGAGLTFGYAQRFQDVEKVLPAEVGDTWTRRPTGGGLVPHLDDVTFSCIFPAEGVLAPAPLYRRLHTAFHQALSETGLEVRLSESGGDSSPQDAGGASQCFQKPVAQDILSGQDKVVGGAIRRMGETVLYQGSLQLPGIRSRATEVESALQRHVGLEWGLEWTPAALDSTTQAAAGALESKYRSVEWIRRR